jgi:hypoxanthine phosphoribosyltransferase
MNDQSLEQVLLDREIIRRRVAELGEQITRDLRDSDLCLMPVMDGGMIFAADLMREIRLPMTLRPIRASSYGDSRMSSGEVRLPDGIPGGIGGKDLLLVDDILDTGKTVDVLRSMLLGAGARTLRTCVLLRKRSSSGLSPDYLGFDIPDSFVTGYGLDLAGYQRNLPHIVIPAGE